MTSPVPFAMVQKNEVLFLFRHTFSNNQEFHLTLETAIWLKTKIWKCMFFYSLTFSKES